MKSLIVLLGALSLSCLLTAQNTLKFGVIADIQYAECDAAGSRYYKESKGKLDACIDTLNLQQVNFTLNLGDILDRNYCDLDSITSRLSRADKPVYSLTGNHDYDGVSNNKELYKKLGIDPKGYYSFEQQGWVFVLLNTNDIASYANVEGTPKEQELLALKQQLKESGAPQTAEWNGGVGAQQLKWLDQLLKKSEKQGKKVLIFTHHPLYPTTRVCAYNNTEVLDVIDKYSAVKGIFAGHHHEGGYSLYNGIPVLIIRGMVETETETSFGIITLSDDQIEIRGYGRESSRTL